MADVGEIFKKLRTDMVADAGLIALFGSGSDIYRKYPQSAHRKPFLIFTIDNLNSQIEISGTAVYRPDITFDVIAINPWDATTIYTYLEENWSIPINKATAIVSANYRMDSLVFGDLIEVPGKLQETDGGEIVTQFTIQAKSRVIKVTT